MKNLINFRHKVEQLEEFKDLDEFKIFKDSITNFYNSLKDQ